MLQSPRAMTRSCRRSLNHSGTTSRRHMLAGLALLAAFAPGAASAQATDWPTKPVTVVVPFAAGGNTDIMARIASQKLAEVFKQGFVVENRVGAGGAIAATYAAQAAPDGYTLTTSSTAYHVIAPVVNPNPGFDPLKDFTHIAYVGGPPNVFVVNPALGVRSLADLVALGRRGQAIDYVSPGSGTLGQLLAESFAQKAGIKLQPIMTKGASQGMMDLVSGNVNLGTMTWTSALGQIRSGKVVPIVISSRARLAEFPDLPTFKDLGYDDLTAVSWFALSGPAGLPKDITQRLNATVATMLERPEVRKRLERDSIETQAMTSEEFTQFVAGEIAKWTPVAKRVMQAN